VGGEGEGEGEQAYGVDGAVCGLTLLVGTQRASKERVRGRGSSCLPSVEIDNVVHLGISGYRDYGRVPRTEEVFVVEVKYLCNRQCITEKNRRENKRDAVKLSFKNHSCICYRRPCG
jgi:hypothetical protein